MKVLGKQSINLDYLIHYNYNGICLADDVFVCLSLIMYHLKFANFGLVSYKVSKINQILQVLINAYCIRKAML